ncbi:MAG: hypothetical protein V2A63_03365, partial [Patescibacteria group bacterium]
AKKITEGEKWKEMLQKLEPTLETFGLDKNSFTTALEKFVGQNPGWFIKIKIDLSNALENDKNKKVFDGEMTQDAESMVTAFKKFNEYFANKKDQLDNFFKLKGIDTWKESPDALLRYFAFNKVEDDIKDFDKWLELKKQEKPSEAPKVEKVAEQKTSKDKARAEEKSENKENSSILQEAKDGFKEGMAALKNGDGLGALMEFLKGFLILKLWDWVKKEAPWLSDSIGSIFGDKEKEKKAEDLKKLEPLLKFLGVEEKDVAKLDDLKKITTADFLEADPEKFADFAKEKKIKKLSADQLKKLQTQLKEKDKANPISEDEKRKTVLNLIQEKPDLLK